MSESYIGLAPSYGVFQKQIIAGTTATTYSLDFDVVQSTQLFVSLDGIVQEPDYSFTIARSSAGQMQIVFAEALTVSTVTGNTTAASASLTNITTSDINVGQAISGTGIASNTFVGAIATAYPSNGDQWDMIYKDNLNSTTTHKDAVEAVKTKWPKDNSGPV